MLQGLLADLFPQISEILEGLQFLRANKVKQESGAEGIIVLDHLLDPVHLPPVLVKADQVEKRPESLRQMQVGESTDQLDGNFGRVLQPEVVDQHSGQLIQVIFADQETSSIFELNGHVLVRPDDPRGQEHKARDNTEEPHFGLGTVSKTTCGHRNDV